ncbi:chitobiase/beta-hexosaminidase C-terminal domain-containing protein [Pedobacter glucosidilyticus]|uniref:chitobiase/beta-hexosaminidase C-terminal domain-containing protein n=1 Tax=Pedobacter glucosidilyticus TaxID=1122941 RepID=UPI0026EECF40|nr:chitobiase/beta-hexosaminidase C-terminal domain-containing protein [Pedobacter glucosidilyticus]
MYNFCNILFGNDNQPTILQQSYTQNKMLAFRLTGGNWVDVSSTINAAWPGEGYNDGNGWITFPAGSSTFRRTNDNAGTWLSYPNLTSNTGSHSVDYQYLYETGKVRYQRVTGTSTSVHTITFSGSTGGQVAQPEINILSGSSFNISTNATITCPTPNTTIRYTTDGSLPTATNGTIYTGPITISNSVTLKARAFHNTKTESRLAASQIIIIGDSQAPSTPQSLNSSAITSSSFSLSWQASNDNVGVTGYEVFRNGVSIANVTGTSYNATGLNASTTYSMAVRAYDAAGNNSALSTALNVTTQAAVSTYRYLRLVAQGTVGLDVTLQSINWLVNTATYPNPRIDNTSSSRVAANVSLTNAWRAYDNSLTSGWTIASNFPATIDVDLGAGNGITPTGIEIDANSANRGLSAFMCYGSNDNTNWTLLHTSSGLTSSHYPNSIGTFTFNNNNQSYRDEQKTPFLAYQKQDDDLLNAYPNPTKGIIYVNQDAAKCLLTLYTLTGTQLYQKQGNFLNLAELPDGIYLLKITVNEKINFKKIILTK